MVSTGDLMARNVSILVVDDEEDIQEVLREILEPEGYAVTAAKSGSEALAALKQDRGFSLVLLDFRLHDISGFDFVAAVGGELLGKVPVVMLSATAGLKQLKLPPGVVGAICKPFDIEELLEAVQRYIRGSSPDIPSLRDFPEVS